MQYARYMDSRLKNSNPTAHAANRLVLLGSPPDTVHGATLRRTGLSSLLIQVRRHITRPGVGIRSRCSGLRVQGTAISPTSAALLHTEAWQSYQLFYYILPHFATTIFELSKKVGSLAKIPLYKRPKGGYNVEVKLNMGL